MLARRVIREWVYAHPEIKYLLDHSPHEDPFTVLDYDRRRKVVEDMSSSIPNKGTALVLEILPAFLGIYGIGWLYAGRVASGLILLLTGLVVIWGSYAAIFLLGALTLGLGFVCICVVILLQIFIAVLSVLSLNNALERAGESSSRP